MGLVAKFSIPGVTGKGKGPLTVGFVGNAGAWNAFGEWADELPLEQYESVICLWEHSYCTDLSGLKAQLDTALTAEKGLSPAGREVVEAIQDALAHRDKKASVIWIADEYAEVPSGG